LDGNEKSDSAAKIGSREEVSDPFVPFLDYVPHIKRALTVQWQREWEDPNRVDKLFEIKPSVLPWDEPNFKLRRQETIIARLRIGHTRITHGHLMSGVKEPRICKKHRVILTIKHILVECDIYEKVRRECFSYIPPPISMKKLLGEGPFFRPNNIFDFLKKVGMYLHI